MNKQKHINQTREKRQTRNRAKIFGTKEIPRLSVFRTNKGIYCQLIDDLNHKTLISFSSLELKTDEKKKKKSEQSILIGQYLAKKAEAAGIKSVIFDRGLYRYHGRVAALAESLRKAGIKF